MQIAIELAEVHKQRIREAVKARQAGSVIKFRANAGNNQVVWWRTEQTRTQHVICLVYGQMQPWLEAVQAEFYAQCKAVEMGVSLRI